jgi:hypothetical protein
MDRLDTAGVFTIHVRPTGKHYVGASKGLRVLWYSYLSLLRRGKHANREIQRAFDLYGEDQVVLEPLESANNRDPMEIEMRVRAWARKLNAVELKRGRPKKEPEPLRAALPPHVQKRLDAALRMSEAERKAEAAHLAASRAERERKRKLEADDAAGRRKEVQRVNENRRRRERYAAKKLNLPLWAVRDTIATIDAGKSKPESEVDDWA